MLGKGFGLGEMTVRKKSDQVLAGESLARKKTHFSSPKTCRASSSQLSLMESLVKKMLTLNLTLCRDPWSRFKLVQLAE